MNIHETNSVCTLNNNQESVERKELIQKQIMRVLLLDEVHNFQEMMKRQLTTSNNLVQAVSEEQKVLLGNVIQPSTVEKHAVTRSTPILGIIPSHTTTIEDNMEKLTMENITRANTIIERGLSEKRMQGLNRLSEIVGADMNSSSQMASTTVQLCTTYNEFETETLKKAILKPNN